MRGLDPFRRRRRRLRERIDKRVAPVSTRLAATEHQITSVEGRLSAIESAWGTHLPAFLNAVSSVGAFAHELIRAQTVLRQEFEEALAREQEAARQELTQRLAEARGALGQEFRDRIINTEGALRQELAQRLAEAGEALEQESHSRITQVQEALHQSTNSLARTQETLRGELRAGIGDAETRLNATRERIEFIRSEVLYELKYGRRARTTENGGPDVRSPEKLAVAGPQKLRINLGCGHLPLEGYVNVDRRELPGVDIVTEADNLPLAAGSVHEIFSAHMLEHFPQEQLRRRLLPYWYELLASGGIFRAVVPDGEAMLAEIAAGTYAFEDFREVLFGGQDYDGDFHYNLFTPHSLCELVRAAGYREVKVPVRARRNGLCYEFEIAAVK